MEAIFTSASFNALGDTALWLGVADEGDVEETVLEVEETSLGSNDEGDDEETVLEVEENSLGSYDQGDVEETPLRSEDECEGDGSQRLWRFRSGSPVTEPDPLPIVDTVEMMLKLDEE